jgi:hypothetical protein
MTDASVAEAAVRYLDGHSLTAVTDEFDVDARTLGRELHRAGVVIRPRRSWMRGCALCRARRALWGAHHAEIYVPSASAQQAVMARLGRTSG